VLFGRQLKPLCTVEHPTAQQKMIILLPECLKTPRLYLLTLNNAVHLNRMIIGRVRSYTNRIKECRHTVWGPHQIHSTVSISDCLTPHKCATLSLQNRQEPRSLNTYNNTPIRQKLNNAFLIKDCYIWNSKIYDSILTLFLRTESDLRDTRGG
jgi:hypothetical protein